MKRLAVFITLLLILAVPTGAALAAPPFGIVIGEGEVYDEDVTVFGDEMELQEGGLVNGDVTVFGGNADIAGTVDGDLAVFGGNVRVSGTITGDLVTFGGNVEITPAGDVSGDCVVLGGYMDDFSSKASCATIGAELDLSGFLPIAPLAPIVPEPPEPPEPLEPLVPPVPPEPVVPQRAPSFATRLGAFALDLGGVLGRTILAGFVAFLLAAFMPVQLRRVSDVVRRKPAASGGVGLLTAVAGPSLLVLLLLLSFVLTFVCVGILGYPIVFVLAVILGAAAIFGWIAIGNVLGEAIVDMFKTKNRSLVLTTTIGTIAMTLVLGLLSLSSFFPGEGLLAFVVLCVGLGATALTQFGTKPYPPSKFDATQTATGEGAL